MILKKALKGAAMSVVLLIGVVLQGCGESGGGSGPLDVATAFWTHMMSTNPDGALPYVMDKQTAALRFNGYQPGDSFKFVGHQKLDDMIILDTRLYLSREGKTKMVPVKTVLVQHGGAWAVDYGTTKMSLYDAVIEYSLNNISDMMVVGVNALESEMPKFQGKKDKALMKDIGNFTASLNQHIYDAINNARISSIKARGEVNGAAETQRRDLLEDVAK